MEIYAGCSVCVCLCVHLSVLAALKVFKMFLTN